MRTRLLTAALVGTLALLWKAQTERDVALAQTRKPITMTRIYTGPDGLSHAEEAEIPQTARGFLEMKASSIQFSRRAPGPPSDWHVGPRRQFVITLSGRAELQLGDGTKVAVGPGHINLIEDTTGKGHITQNLGPEDRIVVTIPLEDRAAAPKP